MAKKSTLTPEEKRRRDQDTQNRLRKLHGRKKLTPEERQHATEYMRKWNAEHPPTDETKSHYNALRKERLKSLTPEKREAHEARIRAYRSRPEVREREIAKGRRRWFSMTPEERRSYLEKRKGRYERMTEEQKQKARDNVKEYRKRTNYKTSARTLFIIGLRQSGLTLGEYETLLEIQGGACGICGTIKPVRNNKRFVIDHCHITGDIRGLLCSKCNSAIGLLSDDVNLLRKAVEWLSRPAFKTQDK